MYMHHILVGTHNMPQQLHSTVSDLAESEHSNRRILLLMKIAESIQHKKKSFKNVVATKPVCWKDYGPMKV
jgi:hypothetical protein